MRSVYEFKLNYAKNTHSGHFGHTCTGTPWTCTGTGCILLACAGTGPGTGTPSGIFPELFLFATFGTISLHTTSIIHIPQQFTWKLSQNNFTTLELVI